MKRVLTGCIIALSFAVPVSAQTPDPAQPREPAQTRERARTEPGGTGQPCSYAECALRVRAPGFTTPAAIMRGVTDSVFVVLPGFSGRLAPLFAQPDSAYFHALRYDTYRRRAFIANIAGPAAFVIGSFFTDWGDRPVSSALMMGGALAITVYGGQVSNIANDELSRTIWWYNRELVETGVPPVPGAGY